MGCPLYIFYISYTVNPPLFSVPPCLCASVLKSPPILHSLHGYCLARAAEQDNRDNWDE